MVEAPAFKFFPELIEHQARLLGDAPYLRHEEQVIGFAEFDRATCRAANGLAALGAGPGDGLAILMNNCPEYLFLFYGLPRAGLYSVPVNVALKKDGLRYILNDSDVRFLAVDDVLYPRVAELGLPLGAIEKVFVRRTTTAALPPGVLDLASLWTAPAVKPGHVFDPEAITHLMYTSGTTGFPKGVVNRHRLTNVPGMVFLAAVLYQPGDVLYTALPLFHANALILTAGLAMAAGRPFGLEKRFSASGFWDSVRKYGGTTFNALGAMVPILMKQPPRPDDADNPVRLVITAACPANLWAPFEKRFGVKIWEAYGAVDGGGTLIFNFGNAPIGSVGRPFPDTIWKLVDEQGREVSPGAVGELIVKVKDEKSSGVEYYKNPKASREKVRDGWLRSGDLFHADREGNLYFVDRRGDSMRRRGENISSFEIENIVEKHPDVIECAAFGVPSELGEDEVMIWIRPRPGVKLDFESLIRHCAENMAHFMVPRYIDLVDEIPRTETLRAIKTDMKARGVTDRTWDREKEMPGFKLK
ncbi:MAG: AMP-binding protein [Thermodesulfobacteriota bacterium]